MCGDVLPHENYLYTHIILLCVALGTCAPVPGGTVAQNQTVNATQCAFPDVGDGIRVIDVTYSNHSEPLSNDTGLSNFTDTKVTANNSDIDRLNKSSVFEKNTTLLFACLDDHVLIGGSLLLVCTESGEWDDAVPKCALSSIGRVHIGVPLIAALTLILLILLPLDFWIYRRKRERIREALKRGRASRNKVRPHPFNIKQQTAHPYFGGIWTTHRLADGQRAIRSDVSKEDRLLKGENNKDNNVRTQSEQEIGDSCNKDRRKKSRFKKLKMKNKKGKVTPFDEEEELTDGQTSEGNSRNNVSDVAAEPYTPRINKRTLPPLINYTDRLTLTDKGHGEQLHELNVRSMNPISTRIIEDNETHDRENTPTDESRNIEPNIFHVDDELESTPTTVTRKAKKQRRLKNRCIDDMIQNNELSSVHEIPEGDAETSEVVPSVRVPKNIKTDSAVGSFDHENDKDNVYPDESEKETPLALPRNIMLDKELYDHIFENLEEEYLKQFSDDGVYSDDGRTSFENSRMGLHENV